MAAGLAYFLLVLLFQRIEGAPAAAFDGYPDEASHYISGLLIKDFLTSGSLHAPKPYAMDYYIHNPFFAIGHWPPLFYAVEALWMSVFGISRPAILALMALIAASTASLLFWRLRVHFGGIAAFGAGFLFLSFPVVLWSSRMVMTDLSVTLLGFAAALAFATYLDSGSIRALAIFSLLAATTLLTKDSGGFLILLPPFATLISGRLHLWKRPDLWLAALGVGVLCLPWYWFAHNLTVRGLEGLYTPPLESLKLLAMIVARNLILLIPFILFGAWRVCRGGWPMPGLAAVCLAQPVAVAVFLVITSVQMEERFFAPALPPLVVLAVCGMRGVADLAPLRFRTPAVPALVWILGVSLFASAAPRISRPAADPFRPIAEFVVRGGYRSVLVPSDAEGAMIADIDELEADRSNRYLIRPIKLLAHSTWTGSEYRVLYQTKEQLQSLFDGLPLDVIILRMNPPAGAPPHEILLWEMVQAFPLRWRVAATFGGGSPDTRYAAYTEQPREAAQQDLGRFLKNLLQDVFYF